jgi:hypothetical protein
MGRWRKVSTESCAALYPAEIEFLAATHRGKKGSQQRFIVWDAGVYRVTGEGRVQIQTASDELVEYEFTVTADSVAFVDPQGCEARFERIAGPPEPKDR